MASKAQRNQQANFFANMQTLFFGGNTSDSTGGQGVLGGLAQATADLKAAADMLAQSTQAQPTYGGPNGNRPTFNGNGVRRPSTWSDQMASPAYPGGSGFQGTYSQIRSSIADQIYARAGSTGPLGAKGGNYYSQHQDPQGKTYYREWTSQGEKVGEYHEGEPGFTTASSHMSRQNVAAGVSNAVMNGSIFTRGANGQVHTPGLSMVKNALSSLGPYGIAAGIILDAPETIGNTITRERDKNAQYQAILGGTNWRTGMHNRRLAEGFKLSQMYSGGFTGAQSEEIFNGITNLGYTGDLRNQALNAASSNYKNLGMGPGESLGFISTMAKSSSTNFEQLKTILSQVSDTAKQTGQNLEQVRNNLQNLFSVATTVNGGAGALQAAGSVANFQAGMGRNFANVDFSGLLPGQNIGITSMMANSAGQELGQFELTQAGGGAGARLSLAKAQDGQAAMAVAPALADPRVRQIIQSLAQKFPQNPTQNMAAFTAFCLKDGSFNQIVGPYINTIMASSKAFMGSTLNAEQAAELIIRQALGSAGSFSAQAQQQRQSMQAYNSLKKGQTDQSLASQGINKVNGKYMQNGQDITGSLMQRHDPILDKFKSQYYSENVHLLVQTGDGERVVTGKYAYDHLKDQIAKGTAKFMDGNNAGQSVADAVGGGFGEENYAGPTTTNIKNTSGKHYKEVAAWEAGTGGKGGGTVVIQPSPALAKLLNISASGNVSIANQSAAAGLQPSPNQTNVVSLGN